jgi:hypothetical protein
VSDPVEATEDLVASVVQALGENYVEELDIWPRTRECPVRLRLAGRSRDHRAQAGRAWHAAGLPTAGSSHDEDRHPSLPTCAEAPAP